MKTRTLKPAHVLTPTLRFWMFHRRGWVKLALTAGQSLTVRSFSEDEEGWSREMETYTYETDDNGEPFIFRQWGEWGRDCDGRHSRTGQDTAALAELAAVPACAMGGTDAQGRWIHRPKWREAGKIENRDEFVELAGY